MAAPRPRRGPAAGVSEAARDLCPFRGTRRDGGGRLGGGGRRPKSSGAHFRTNQIFAEEIQKESVEESEGAQPFSGAGGRCYVQPAMCCESKKGRKNFRFFWWSEPGGDVVEPLSGTIFFMNPLRLSRVVVVLGLAFSAMHEALVPTDHSQDRSSFANCFRFFFRTRR